MDNEAFAAAHQAEWDRLAVLVDRSRRLTGPEIDELVELYQRAGTHLSRLRAGVSAVPGPNGSADPVRTAQLTTLVARARAAVTGAHVPSWQLVARFARYGFPAAVYRARWWWLGAAAGSLLVAVVTGWWIARDPGVQSALLPPAEAKALVQQQFQGYYTASPAASFAAKVWTNNVWVAAEALIFGILLGIPTVFVLFENSLNLGVNAGYLFAHSKGVLFFSLILPHGMLELSAVFLAAAAGLRLGWTVIDPGNRRRGQALAEEGRAAVTIAIGLIVVLGVSGVIEAFVTPSHLPTWLRIGIGAAAVAAFIAYALVFGRRAVAAGHTGDIEEAPDLVPVA
ncbi:MAG TPA: stage II sporulation protein M [Trebonia sp.]|nr:stage II sporulation protein M [Trebonia sp.]